MYPPIRLCIHPSVSMYPSILYLCIHLCIYLFIHSSSIQLLIHPSSVDPSICPPNRLGMCQSLSRVRRFATPWTVARQAPPCMGFSRQERWSGLPFPPPGVFLTQGLKSGLLLSSLSIHTYIYPSTYIHASIYLSVRLHSNYPSTHLSLYPSICISICLCIHTCTHMYGVTCTRNPRNLLKQELRVATHKLHPACAVSFLMSLDSKNP